LTLCALVACILTAPLAAQARPARVAVILDRDSPRFHPLVEAFQREVRGFFRPGEIELLPPRAGDGTAAGVEAVLNGALRDPAVAVVVALGSVGSHLLARSGSPPKPSIAAIIIDASWQDIPQREGASGIRRLTYVDQSYPVGSTLADFHRLIPFRKLAVLLDSDLLHAIPELETSAAALVRATGAEAAIVPARNDADAILAALPAGVDAVYLTPLPAMPDAQYAQLLAGLNARRLPTLSYTADPDVRLGALASYEPPENWQHVRELETGPPVGIPVSIRLSGDHMPTLRALTARLMAIFRANRLAERVQQDWGSESFAVDVAIDPDRASRAGLSNADVALSTAIGLNGLELTDLHEGDKTIPVIARLRMEEWARLGDLRNLYVYSSQGTQKVSLRQIAALSTGMRAEKINRRNQFRTITVGAFPKPGVLSSEVLAASKAELDRFEESLPPGIRFQIAGELEKQQSGFTELALILGISVALIYLALAVQFKSAVKPWIVFGAIPYGMVGAVAALWVMGAPFGFMAFLGIVSLVGVIVSHVIVLFDFIEEAREKGEGLEEALLDAGILRLRPVLITVGATIFALVPLALHGGPLWEPLCYAQIGGLAAATVITLLLVPVFYSISVLDLKIVKWEPGRH